MYPGVRAIVTGLTPMNSMSYMYNNEPVTVCAFDFQAKLWKVKVDVDTRVTGVSRFNLTTYDPDNRPELVQIDPRPITRKQTELDDLLLKRQ